MPKQHKKYSHDTIDIFKKLINYYASSNTNIWKECPILNRMYIQVKEEGWTQYIDWASLWTDCEKFTTVREPLMGNLVIQLEAQVCIQDLNVMYRIFESS